MVTNFLNIFAEISDFQMRCRRQHKGSIQYLLIASFFAVCSLKGSGKLSKVLLVHHQRQRHHSGDACITSIMGTGEAYSTGIKDTSEVIDHY
jgi:hypothetical protein